MRNKRTGIKIGLAGKSGSGKDLIADYIGERYGFKKIAVADALKIEVYDQLVNPSEEFLSVLQEVGLCHARPPKVPIPQLVNPTDEEKIAWINDNKKFLRSLLQYYGTEYRKAKDPDYWIKKLAVKLDNDEWIVVSDIRTPEEMIAIEKAGGEVWFVERPGVAPVGIPNHYTEIALEGQRFARTISNTGTIDSLKAHIDELFRETL